VEHTWTRRPRSRRSRSTREGGEEGDEADEAADRREIKWSLPEGLKVADKPPLLDASLEGKTIYLRWERPHGWLVGKINEKFTQATPRLFAKFNYRIKWFDGWENHKLDLDNYNSGPAAPYNSWVLLEKEEAETVKDQATLQHCSHLTL